jgi:hypothetical protein
VVEGTEGPGSFNELDKLVVASLQPLQTVGASKSGSEGEGRARGVKVEDRGRRRRGRGSGRRGESMWGWWAPQETGEGEHRREGHPLFWRRD